MAEIHVMRDAQIRKGGELVFDLSARGLTAVKITAHAGEHAIDVIMPVPKNAPTWLMQLLAQTIDQAVEKTVEALGST